MKRNLFVMLFVASLFASCGGASKAPEVAKEVFLKPAQTEIKGDLKGCYEVVDKNYKVKFAQKSYESDVVTVELLRTTKEFLCDRDDVVIFPEAKKSSAAYCAGLGIEILDENGDVIDKISPKATPYSWNAMTDVLRLLPEETATIEFHFDDLSKAVAFRVTSIVQKNEDRTLTNVAKKGDDIDNAVAGLEAMMGVVDDAVELSKDLNDVGELYKTQKEAMETAGKAMETAGKMFDALESMW